jgi:predicted CopG family antitoxin
MDNIYELLDKLKEEEKSFVKEINTKREFKNPEYLHVL